MSATPWLSILGIGEDGIDGLIPAARTLLAAAEIIVGGERHLALVPDRGTERWSWKTPLRLTVDDILAARGRRVCVLGSGDPMWFGIGVTLARHVAHDELVVLPHLSAFTLAASRMAWPLGDCDCVTVHGRHIDLLRAHLVPGGRLLVLSEDGATPAAVARLLTQCGWGPSAVTALMRMGGPHEQRIEAPAAQWSVDAVDDLNTLAIALRPAPGTRALARIPGLPDDSFLHDGQLTKQEIRAATLAELAPLPGELLWDVGAGSGSIAIEWMRAAPRARAVAIEREAARVDLIARNAGRLGVPRLDIRHAAAPAILAALPPPDAVFIGGGISDAAILRACWDALRDGGRIVANVVTIEGEAELAAAHARHGGTLRRLAVSRLERVGPYHGWRPLMPVTQWSALK